MTARNKELDESTFINLTEIIGPYFTIAKTMFNEVKKERDVGVLPSIFLVVESY